MTGLAVLGIALGVLVTILAINRLMPPRYGDIEKRAPKETLLPAGADLSVLTWNVGYGALGKDADLYMDGGRSLRALSKPQITAASQDIARRLSETSCDLLCIQETAKAGFTTRNVDVRAMMDSALADRHRYFWADFRAVLVPFVLDLCHGMATYTAKLSDQCRVIALPGANTYFLGVFNKRYAGLLNRVPIRGSEKAWVIINIHLPVFNTTPAARAAQLDALFGVALHEFEKGNYVIIAGDWNTRLCPTPFAHSADQKYLTSYTDFPRDCLPTGWEIIADPSAPTVRAIDAPFVRGQTYTTVFDGFVISPNLRCSSVKTHDLGFAHSDHHPVEGRFHARL